MTSADMTPGGKAVDAEAAADREAAAVARERALADLLEIGAVAIVGVAGRFPGAASVEAFWQNLRDGVDAITHFTPDQLDDSFDGAVRADPDYVPARPILTGIDRFDAPFFGMLAREAALTDPQQRVLLECAWEGLEDAGHDPASFAGAIGVFAGCSMNTYFLRNVCADRAVIEQFTNEFQVGQYPMLVGAGHDFVATRIAYKLDLRGPAMTVASACSTSLLAVAQAVQSLQTYQCDMALAGGASISFPQQRGYLHQAGGMVSPDGRCRPFDAEAGGTVFGSGAAMVVLRRLEDALADGDHIYAVVRGSGVNNDGSGKVGFTSPSVDGQAAAIASAHQQAGVSAASIGYVEAHGTATPLGDPIEFAGLCKAFGRSAAGQGFCSLGSAKANVGHLDAAAGVTGLIKAALSLKHAEIPPLLHFREANPGIELAGSPFRIDRQLAPWPAGTGPRRTGTSAFGVGGTNVHVVMEEAPLAPRAPEQETSPLLFPLSARGPAALKQALSALADHLEQRPDLPLGDVAHTLQVGRRAFDARAAVVARDRDDLLARLRQAASGQAVSVVQGRRPVVFMFPGQGAQVRGMGRALYEAEPLFRSLIDRGAACVAEVTGEDIRQLLFGAPIAEAEADPSLDALNHTVNAQPALFLVEYATARLLMSWGIQPDAMAGHSIGELVAAVLAGVFTFDDAARAVAARGQLMFAQPPGAMLSVRLGAEELVALLPDGVEIAAANAPKLSVAAGADEAVAALEAVLADKGIVCRRLRTSHAFHSVMMESVVEPLTRRIAAMRAQEPAIPFISCVSGTWATPAQAMSPVYWGSQCRAPVQFADALRSIGALERPILIEVGPGQTLAALARQALRKEQYAGLVGTLGAADEPLGLREAVAALWTLGVRPDWAALTGTGRRRVSLPTYRFQRERHWVDAPAAAQPSIVFPAASEPALPPAIIEGAPSMSDQIVAPAVGADSALEAEIIAILEDLSGEKLGPADRDTSFLELGFDSLFLAQVATKVQQSFKVPLTFRQLLGDLPNIAGLAGYLAPLLPQRPAAPAVAAVAPPQPAAALHQTAMPPAAVAAATPSLMPSPAPSTIPAAMAGDGGLSDIFRLQLGAMQQIIAQQIGALQSVPHAQGAAAPAPLPLAAPQSVSAPSSAAAAPPPTATMVSGTASDAAEAGADTGSRFQVYRPAKGAAAAITLAQQGFIDGLIARMNARAPGSKAYTQRHRGALADPRAAAGFRAEWKELVYPIVCARSKGARIWDVDGNEYIDLVNGYGQTAFGHAPDFVMEAVAKQMAEGFAIGPQSPLAGEVADLFSELTGNERVTFCNTGSEAVMAAMRLARTVTGRDKVVLFGGGYHGQFDEVLVKGGSLTAPPKALPVAPGIPRGSVGNMVVLPYATPDSLAWVRANADSLAAVIVEPVQSRHPALVPVDFLKEIRAITAQSGTAFVFDEVVTGFRTHPGGMQAVLGIRADLATYGKVVGGGLPIGILAGSSRFMDALDGGQWRFGDSSVPEVAPTFFAGTFVRHPLVLAAARAVLLHLREAGPALQQGLATRTAELVGRINRDLERRGIRSRAETYSSWFYLNFSEEDRFGPLFFHQARALGLHVQDGFPAFLTTQHGAAEMEQIFSIFSESLDALQGAGILTHGEAGSGAPASAPVKVAASAAEPLPNRVPPTEPQREVWLAAQGGDDISCAFNESVSVRFEGVLDAEALQAALAAVVARHDALRGRFERSGEHFLVDDAADFPIERHDVSGDADPEAELRRFLALDAATPFDLVDGPLARAALLTLGVERHVLVFSAHHIVCDGWSMNIILSELVELYAERVAGTKTTLEQPLPFRRYALDEAAKAGSGGQARSASADYWLARFAELPPEAELPSDRPRAAMKTFRGATLRGAIDAGLYRAVKTAGARQGATLFTTLASAFQVVMWRLTGVADQVVAIPTAGQSLITEGGPLVGHCVNFLPLRTTIAPEAPAGTLLKAVQKAMVDLNEHQDYTFGTLVRQLGIPRNPARLPLTQVQFNLERLGGAPMFGEATASIAPNAKAFTNFDLFLNVIEGPEGLRLDCDYNTDLFDEATVGRWLGHFEQALRALAADATQPVGALSIIPPADLDWLSKGLNDAWRSDLDLRPLPDLVSAQAVRSPDAVAVRWRERSLTYRELDAASDTLARRLIREVPQAGQRIGILCERSLELVVGLLAIMKAGHAFVPLDPQHPAARIRLVIDNARMSALLTDDRRHAELAPALPLVLLAEAGNDALEAALPRLTHQVTPDDSAYVIFTSGSTGTPKGVEIGHLALSNLLWSFAATPGFKAGDSLLAVTTITFDIAILELFLPLIAGGTVTIADREEVQGGFGLVARIAAERPTHIQATPSLWRMLLEAGFKPYEGLTMLCGGEPLPRDLADALGSGAGSLWNVYGPTETTIWSSAGPVASDADALVTIGAPVFNTELHVLDADGRIAPIGVAGDLVIGGKGLAKGYFDQAALTATAFRLGSPDGGAQRRLYHTGDLARRLADGSIQHLGRRDLQIKLRGFRIELEDIETAMRAFAGVTAAAAGLAGKAGDQRLVGYYVAAPEQPVALSELQAHVRGRLPDYMVPAIWLRLDALPMTPNGKLDRKALPEPDLIAAAAANGAGSAGNERVVVAPRNATEQALASIWGDVLQISEVGVEDNLFSLGADSIHVFRIAARMLDQGLGLEAKHLMRHPTVAELARVASEIANDSTAPAMPAAPSLASFRRRSRTESVTQSIPAE